MNHRRLLLATIALCALGAAALARADTLPPAPAGFSWVTSANDAGSFLRPDGWSTKEETQGDTHALFITRTPLADGGRFDVGFTVNLFEHVSNRHTTASVFARLALAGLETDRKILKRGVVKGNALDLNVLRVVDTRGGPPVVIHYLAIGDDARDRAWLIFFEAPQSEWDADYPIAKTMLDVFGL